MAIKEQEQRKIYLDYNSTTPLLPEVLDAMLPYLRDIYGNPSSGHWFGQRAKNAVEWAREQVAVLINCDPEEVIFTSGGSEGNNQAVKGVVAASGKEKNHIITSSIEHPAMKNPCGYLENCKNCSVTYLPVDRYARVNPADVDRTITRDTVLVTVMFVQNEVGTIEPIEEIGEICRKQGIYFHSDASQAVGKIPVKVDRFNIDLMTICAHKFYGPKGVGALYIRKGTNINSFIHGSGHERGLRAGTENVAGLVGMGKAAEIAAATMETEVKRITTMRNDFCGKLQARIDGVVVNTPLDKSAPGTLHVSFSGINGNDLLERVPEICATTGAACADRAKDISGVLKAMGVSKDIGLGSVRFSIGKFTTPEEIEYSVTRLAEAVSSLRSRIKV